MSDWKKRVLDCIGDASMKFANHTSDENLAEDLKVEFEKNGIFWKDVEIVILEKLKDCTGDHIKTELKKARKFFIFK